MGGGASQVQNEPTVVIVGGGYAGKAAAEALDAKFNVVVIERKPFLFHNIGALRAVAGPPGYSINFCMIPNDKMLKRGHVVQAEVECIASDGVHLRGRDQPVKFDYLIIATGTSYAFPFKVANTDPSEIVKMVKEVQSHIKEAQHITVVGGGPVGTELVGELLHAHPTKKYTLVSNGTRLIGAPYKVELSEKLESQLKASNVDLIMGERVEVSDEDKQSNACFLKGKRTLRTQSGRSIESDLTFLCLGAHVNSKSYAGNFPTSEQGFIKIDQGTFQVLGHTNVFAIGDCADRPENKLGFLAGMHGRHVAKVLHAMVKGKVVPKFVPPAPMICVPLGPYGGAGQLPFMGGRIIGKKITRAGKGKSLFVKDMWALMNAEIPKKILDLDAEGSAVVRPSEITDDEAEHLAKILKLSPEEARMVGQLRTLAPTNHVENYT